MTITLPPRADAFDDVPLPRAETRTPADRAFRGILLACSSTVLIVIGGILIYLVVKSRVAWSYQGFRLITTDSWAPRSAHPSLGFAGALLGSAVVAIVALVVALPISIATALAINEYAPRRLRGSLTSLVDLLAALPSIVFGMWGLLVLNGPLRPTTAWMGRYLNFFPPFRLSGANLGNSLFEAGLIVGIMITPIITSISREVMSQVPRDQCEAALALGGTRWGMVTDVILPFSRGGIFGGAMLGLGRALGESMAVSIILVSTDKFSSAILQPGSHTVSQLIVTEFQTSSELERSALVVAGLALFAVTLFVNLGARAIVSRAERKAR
jgi:phosphate transport system permease protein